MTQSVWMRYQVSLVVKELPANAGDVRDAGSIPGLGRSPRGGHGNALQYSCLENPVDRGAWRATVHGGPKESNMTEHAHSLPLEAPSHPSPNPIYVGCAGWAPSSRLFHTR